MAQNFINSAIYISIPVRKSLGILILFLNRSLLKHTDIDTASVLQTLCKSNFLYNIISISVISTEEKLRNIKHMQLLQPL